MNDLEKILIETCEKIIKNSISDEKIEKIKAKHIKKVHFIPLEYRVLGGILQSMNIQLGNFIEGIVEECIKIDSKNEIMDLYSGKRQNKFELSTRTDEMIDNYITDCQTGNYTESQLNKNYTSLLQQININEKSTWGDVKTFNHDIDILFKRDNSIYYVEIKYNDDHDTGKFTDINRKFLKTYAYIRRELFKEKAEQKLIPILFYFNNKKLKGNIYLPENMAVVRGEQFFQNFTNISYKEISDYMQSFSENPSTLKAFDSLRDKIIKHR